MKKKIIIGTILVAIAAVPVFASEALENRSTWFNQMFQRHQQQVQNYVTDGTITQKEADQLSDAMQKAAPVMQKIMQKGGMKGGPGMMMGGSGANGTCPGLNNNAPAIQ